MDIKQGVCPAALALVATVILLAGCAAQAPLDECTLWAVTGNAVEGNGTLIAKNRDWVPDHKQELRLFMPADGYVYFGLYALGGQGESRGLKAGINQPGLVAISASASTIPEKERLSLPHTPRLISRILSQSRTVDEALAHQDWFLGPEFIMLADRTKIAVIEIAPEGKTAVSIVENGTASHTNQYLDVALAANNRNALKTSSTKRLARIRELLTEKSSEINLSDFVTWSLDTRDGPDNSIWRTGSTPQSDRTLASWIVSLPASGDPLLFVRLANPGQELQELTLNPIEIFQAGDYKAPAEKQ